MPEPSSPRTLYTVEALSPAGESVEVRLRPAGIVPAPPIAARVSGAAEMALLRRTVQRRGFVAARPGSANSAPSLLPATVGLKLEMMTPDGAASRVLALPRPAPVRIGPEQTDILRLVRTAIDGNSGAVFAVDPATGTATDAALIPREQAEDLLGLVRR